MQDPSSLYPQINPPFPEHEHLKCPRCDSTNTKFCYYNNYNLSQPRHFCKSCRRYWTRGGTLRNVPVGGGTRRSSSNKRPRVSTNSSSSSTHDVFNVSNPSSALSEMGPGPAFLGCDVNLNENVPEAAGPFLAGGFVPLGGFGPRGGFGLGLLDFPLEALEPSCGGGGGGGGSSSGWQMCGVGDGLGDGDGDGDGFSWPELAISTQTQRS